MRSKHAMIPVVGAALLFLLSTPAAFAYSLYPSATGTTDTTSVTSSLNLSNSWGQLSAPFQNFFNSLGSVSPGDLPNEIVNPSTQIQAMIPAADKGTFTEVLNFLSVVIGWLIGISDWFAHWVISIAHGA